MPNSSAFSKLGRRSALLILGTALIAGCGGSGGSGSAQVRVVNAIAPTSPTVGAPTIDVFATDSLLLSAVAPGTASAYSSLGGGSYTVRITNTGSATALSSTSASVAGGTTYTLVAWGRASAVQAFYLTDGEAASTVANTAKIRVLNTAVDAGSVDMYLTDASTDLSAATAVAAGTAGGRVSIYNEVTAGTYRLRITAAGSKTDVRLDLPSFTVAATDISTLVLQPSQGGVLVHGLQVLQQGAVTAKANTQARARVIASVAGNGAVTATLGGTSLNVGLPSPAVGPYVLVPSGSPALSMTVNGTAVAAAPTSIVAGGDYTFMAYGPAATPLISTIVDDNRLPTSATGARMRLINGLQGQGALTLAMDFSSVAGNVAFGAASDYAAIASNTSARLDVTSGLTGNVLFTTGSTNVNIRAQGVFTVMVLDGGTSATGFLRNERPPLN